ncbi:MAG: hypothetical protein H7066_06780 [Cytophagaceae bacterium]|nr:hypothetical protein [Gemmatimonadaceae bacterium]
MTANGCMLLTGTGVMSPHDVTAAGGDEITGAASGLETLRNNVGEA